MSKTWHRDSDRFERKAKKVREERTQGSRRQPTTWQRPNDDKWAHWDDIGMEVGSTRDDRAA